MEEEKINEEEAKEKEEEYEEFDIGNCSMVSDSDIELAWWLT